MHPLRSLLLITCLVASITLTGCGDDSDDEAPSATGSGRTTAGSDEPTTTEQVGTDTAGPGEQDRPPPGTCERLPEEPDGLYTVGDAGTAVVQRQGDGLTVGEIRPADEWTHEIETEESDEIEIEFRRDSVELDLEVEIDDGQVEVRSARTTIEMLLTLWICDPE